MENSLRRAVGLEKHRTHNELLYKRQQLSWQLQERNGRFYYPAGMLPQRVTGSV